MPLHLGAVLQARTLQSTLVTRSRGDPEAGRAGRIVTRETRAQSALDPPASNICHVIGCIVTPEMRVQSALDDLASNNHHFIECVVTRETRIQSTLDDAASNILPALRGGESGMLAELMFQKEHYETAIYHFQQLLEKNPRNFSALAQLVQLLRRSGRLVGAGPKP